MSRDGAAPERKSVISTRLCAALLAVMVLASACATAPKPSPVREAAGAAREEPASAPDCEAQARAAHSYFTQLALQHGLAGTLYLSFVGAARGALFGVIAGGGNGASKGAWIGAAAGAGVGLVLGGIEGWAASAIRGPHTRAPSRAARPRPWRPPPWRPRRRPRLPQPRRK